MPWDDSHARRQVARAEELLSGLDTLPDGVAAARAAETVAALVGLYGECLARITAAVSGSAHGDETLRALAGDPLVGHLLLVHDLHPDPVEVRVREALAALPGGPELLELTATAARVRVAGGCGSAGAEQAVREALAARAPEIEDVTVETAGTSAGQPALIPVDTLFRTPTAACAEAAG